MKYYYVEANPSWFIVYAKSKREAYKEGKKEYGSGSFISIREATKREIEYFRAVKGKETATVTARGWRISQRQLRHVWMALCGDLDCPACGYGGLAGDQKWRLKKMGGIFSEGAEIIGG